MSKLSEWINAKLGKKTGTAIEDAVNKSTAAALQANPQAAAILKAFTDAEADGKITADEFGDILEAINPHIAQDVETMGVNIAHEVAAKAGIALPFSDDEIRSMIAQELHDAIGLS